MVKKSKTERLNLRVSSEQMARLERLMKMSDSPNLTETVRRALAVYEHLWKARKSKTRVILCDDDGNESDLMLM